MSKLIDVHMLDLAYNLGDNLSGINHVNFLRTRFCNDQKRDLLTTSREK